MNKTWCTKDGENPIGLFKTNKRGSGTVETGRGVTEFASKFRNLLLQLDNTLPDDEVLFLFLTGLKENTRKRVRDANPENLDQAVQSAERYDNIYHQTTGSKEPVDRNRFGNY
jgi:hypothetical protein